jgi:hypothetical protein
MAQPTVEACCRATRVRALVSITSALIVVLCTTTRKEPGVATKPKKLTPEQRARRARLAASWMQSVWEMQNVGINKAATFNDRAKESSRNACRNKGRTKFDD